MPLSGDISLDQGVEVKAEVFQTVQTRARSLALLISLGPHREML